MLFLFAIFIIKRVLAPPQIPERIKLINFPSFNCKIAGKNTKLHNNPIQKDEHSMHSNIFLKNFGALFATKFLTGIKSSERDHIILIPQETKRKHIKLFIFYYIASFLFLKKCICFI